MSGTRVELRVSFTVSSDLHQGHEAAEHAIHAIERLGVSGQLDDCYDFEVTRGSVNGNAWHERWPDTRATAYDWNDDEDDQDPPAVILQRVIDGADRMTDLSGTEPLIERLAEQVRDLAEVVYALIPKDTA